MSGACCSPGRGAGGAGEEPRAPAAPATPTPPAGRAPTAPDWVAVEGGTFVMGDDSAWSYPADGEGPARPVTVGSFRASRAPVTNEEFAAFVAVTGHRSDAERYGWSFVFAGRLPDDFPETRGVVGAEWWRQVEGAWWAAPEGPGSDVGTRGDHPVVHVSWNDATAYASWVGGRLPTEAEWERAARGGTQTTFPWGAELEPGGRHMANVFQGDFPTLDTGADGWPGTSPVGAFPPNGFGLVDVIGNVWEWTADRFSPDRFGHLPAAAPVVDPTGPGQGGERVLKGGSYLCHASYCRRYRPAARMGSAPDSSSGNMGFRVASDRP